MTDTSTMARATPLDGALWLVRHGFTVFPADHPGLVQCAGIGRGHEAATCTDRGKHPAVPFTKAHTLDEDQVRHDFDRGQLRNVGIAVGACSGPNGEQLVVVDSDRPGAIEDTARGLGRQHMPTMRVFTAKGYHDYYWAPAGVQLGNRLGALQGKFDGDVRAGNAFVIGPGSVHATGVSYELEDADQPPVALPEWLLTALQARPAAPAATAPAASIVIQRDRHDAYTRKVLQAECDAIAAAPDGDQNNAINRASFNVGTLVGAGALSEGEARQTLLAAARAGNHPEGRAHGAIDSGLSAGMDQPRTPWPPVARASSWPTMGNNFAGLIAPEATATAPTPAPWVAPQETVPALPSPMPAREWDDIGNAQRVVDRFGTEVRWIADTEQWATYDRGQWSFKGANTSVWTRVVATINALPEEADNYSEEKPTFEPGEKPTKEEQLSERERFDRFARQQRMRPKLAAAREVLQAHPGLHVHMDHFDKPEMLLNVGNGIVDLTTGELLPHDRGLYLMQQSPVHYRPGATAPMWEDFLASVMPDEERRAYLARVIGYTLTGSTQEQAMFIHHGSGQNGKGVFMRILMALLGEYAQSVPRSTLLAKQADGIPNDVARMVGKRLLATTETSAGKKLDDELVKQLTGEDTMSARFMRAEFFDFRPVGKIHLATNYLPSVGSGHGMARRLQDIGWDVTVPAAKRVAKLDEKIMATEAAGVLNWAIAGCIEWQKHGLAVPAAVQEKTREHIANSDPLAMWLDEETEETPDHVVETRQLYASYKVWSDTANLRPMSMTAFSLALGERAIESGKDSRTRRAVTFGRRLVAFAPGI
ncbi:phage/plasmid primase, P4 family [Streptomyces sp. NBC_00208]|uniref:phage/plasmid primase, P4 family n=1 Tax=Streptomyces sp. NBC_00208 TaxID=2975681 RepID=UPI002E2A40D1|nr:phage/plasmid primase, P4 family [Streptomyces sp. NBC_00208]